MGLLERAGKSAQGGERPHPRSGGFLERAQRAREEDPIEHLCDERLSRLSSDEGGPYAALTILKACFPYQAAYLARRREDGSSEVYASLGLEPYLDPGIPPIFLEEDGPRPVESLGLVAPEGSAVATVLSLSASRDAGARRALVVIQREADPVSAEALRRIVDNNSALLSGPRDPAPAGGEILRKEVERALAERGGAGELVVLEFPSVTPEGIHGKFLRELEGRVGDLGVVLPLRGNRVLIVFRPGVDRELYAYQVLKTLRKTLPDGAEATLGASVSAKTIQDAYPLLDSLI